MKARDELRDIELALSYYTGEAFFAAWIGPTTAPDDPKRDEILAKIEKVFQSSNRIKECIDRHRTALVGKKPHWYFTDATGSRLEDGAASEAELLMQRWIDRQYRLGISQDNQLIDALAEATKNMLVTGRGYLRLWSPRRFRNSPDLISRVCLHSPHPGAVTIKRDADGFTDTITYSYSEQELQRKEVQFVDPETNLTVFSTLDEQGMEIPDQTFALDLGGRYSIYEMRSPSLVSDQSIRAQNAINFALTVLIRNIEVGGFRERLILGGQPPGTWSDDGKTFTPNPGGINTGPTTTNFIQGTPLYNDLAQLRGYTNPSVFNAEPVTVSTFIDTVQFYVNSIYHEFKQAHLLGSDLQLSGISREQARQDFETSLGEHADIVSSAISGAYGAALLMLLQPVVSDYRNLDVMVQLRLAASKPTPQERAENREDYKAGLRSRTTAMAASGIDDIDGETALIDQENQSRTAIEDATNLTVSGLIDQPAALELLRSRRVLGNGVSPGSSDEGA